MTLLTIFVTIFTGTIIFICGQLIQRVIIEPIQEQRKNVAKIAQALTVHRYAYLSRDSYRDDPEARKKIDVTSAEIKKLAADLRAGYSLIPFNAMFARWKLVPAREAVRRTTIHLVRWATFESDQATIRAIQHVAQLLNIDFIENDEKEFNDVMIEGAGEPVSKDAK